MSYTKFKVTGIKSTPSGTYAIYTSESGYETWTGNYNFKIGDIVEWWDYDGYCPSKIIVNGIVTWTDKDKKRYWETKDQRDKEHIEETCKHRGLYHSDYNPKPQNIS